LPSDQAALARPSHFATPGLRVPGRWSQRFKSASARTDIAVCLVPEPGPSGLMETKESELGFPFSVAYASLPDAHRNIFHGLRRGAIPA
jgi:hypothetical protein